MDKNQDTTPCSECQAGMLHLRYITYFTWLNEELVSVPNFPAWICDICGRRVYDQHAITWLTAMLNPETGIPSSPSRRLHPPREDERPPIRPSPVE
jgi:YgiT-type zinc finger domain-containing protein